MLKLSDIHFSYGETQVLKGINLDVRKGEIISIVGASGAGKTTLLHILGTLEIAKSGNYLINDKSVFNPLFPRVVRSCYFKLIQNL